MGVGKGVYVNGDGYGWGGGVYNGVYVNGDGYRWEWARD